MATQFRFFQMVERVVLNVLANERGFAAGYLRLRRLPSIVFGAVTDAKQRPGFPPDPPLAATNIGGIDLNRLGRFSEQHLAASVVRVLRPHREPNRAVSIRLVLQKTVRCQSG
jgi:hypothetical protein